MQSDWRFSHTAQPISGTIMQQICRRLPKEQRPKRRRRLTVSADELRARELARLSDYIPPSISRLRSMTPAPFRDAIAMMFERLGYEVINDPTGGSQIIVTKGKKKHIVCCARPADYEPTRAGAIAELHHKVTTQGADSGFYITAREFTKEAIDYRMTAPVQLFDAKALQKSMKRSMHGMDLPITYDAACTQCGDIVTHRLDKAKALPCAQGHPVPPTIALAAIQPKEYPIEKKGKRRRISPKFAAKLRAINARMISGI